MRSRRVKPDNYTLSSLIKGVKPCRDYWNQFGDNASCVTDHRVSRALFIVGEMHRKPNEFGDQPDEILYNCLLDLCVRFKDTKTALKVFDQMRGYKIQPSAITYGILIKAFGIVNKLDKAFGIFKEMKSHNLIPNSVTYGCLLDACVKNSDIKRANQVFECM